MYSLVVVGNSIDFHHQSFIRMQIYLNLIDFEIFQYQLKQSASSAAVVRPPLNVSTDAMSLDGILDSISCGSISSPPSPANYLSK